MSKLTGMGGSVTVVSVVYPVKEWAMTIKNETQTVTDTGSSGWQEKIAGVSSASGSFTAYWGGVTQTLTTSFTQGSIVTASFAIGSSAHAVSGSFIIDEDAIKNDATSPVEFSCTCSSTGAVTVS